MLRFLSIQVNEPLPTQYLKDKTQVQKPTKAAARNQNLNHNQSKKIKCCFSFTVNCLEEEWEAKTQDKKTFYELKKRELNEQIEWKRVSPAKWGGLKIKYGFVGQISNAMRST